MKIALPGDYDAMVLAHQAIPGALEISARALASKLEPIWMRSGEVEIANMAAL